MMESRAAKGWIMAGPDPSTPFRLVPVSIIGTSAKQDRGQALSVAQDGGKPRRRTSRSKRSGQVWINGGKQAGARELVGEIIVINVRWLNV